MIKLTLIYCLGILVVCDGREPFKPRDGSLPFLVYFSSRYRGLCIGTLVSRTAVITAAVCVTSPYSTVRDTRPINVITGATYRHPRRGIRVQVTKILLPAYAVMLGQLSRITERIICRSTIVVFYAMKVANKQRTHTAGAEYVQLHPGFKSTGKVISSVVTNASASRVYYLQMSPAILLLKRKVPDILTEIPLRAIEIDYKGQETLTLQEECLMAGWHYFYKGDKIYPVQRFLLQRNIRVQFLNIVKKHLWCDTLSIKFQKALMNIGYTGHFEKSSSICIRDGMYGAPLICNGKVVAMLMAPDAQWSNCTGFSNLVHLFTSKHLRGFMDCVSSLFAPEFILDWEAMKNSVYDEFVNHEADYLPDLYDKILGGSSSSEEF